MSLFNIQKDFDVFLNKTFFDRIYNDPEFQELLTADEATQNAYLVELRKTLGLDTATSENVEKATPPETIDITKKFEDFVKQSQSQNGNTGSDLQKRFEQIKKSGVIS